MTEIQHELIMPNKDLPFKMFLFEGRDGNYIREKHWHRSIEIFAVFQGTLEFYLNDQEYLLECGDFIIVNSNEVHSIHAPKENMTVVLQMPLNMFEKYYTQDQFICFAHAPQAQDEQLMEMICEMYMAYSDKHCGYDLKIQSLFYDMLYLMVTRYREINVHPDILHQHKQLTKLSVITDVVNEENFPHLRSLSLTGCRATETLKDLTQIDGNNQYNGKDVGLHVNIRTEHGYRQLIETKMTISDISMENGFPNNKAFSKAFYKKYGIMPAEFRKRQKSAINKISN